MIPKRLQMLLAAIYLVARFYAAFTLLSYGFAKVMGAQFTILDSELAKPMGDVSGFWLTWYYFGYSPVYAAFVAWAQIIGAVLLCFRRTALAGVLLLLPIMLNIVCIDVWVIRFPFGNGALRNAIFVLSALVVALFFHGADLHRFLWKRRDDLIVMTSFQRWSRLVTVAVVIGMVAYTAHDGYWLANVNNRAPSAIDGAWKVQSEQQDAKLPDWIYFEYNRAYMVVFHFASGTSETHDFRVDDGKQSIEIGREWLSPGSDIFAGKWTRSDDTLILQGTWKGQQTVSLTLQRKAMPIKDYR